MPHDQGRKKFPPVHHDGSECVVDDALLQIEPRASDTLPIDSGERGTSLLNPKAGIAFVRIAKGREIDGIGVDRFILFPMRRSRFFGVRRRLAHAARCQWLWLPLQLKGIPEGAPGFGECVGTILPLRDALNNREKRRLTPDMIRQAHEHMKKHRQVTAILFVSLLPRSESDAYRGLLRAVRREINRLARDYLAILRASLFPRHRAT